MDVKKLLRFGCPAARPPPPPQSANRPPTPLVGFSSGPKYIHRLVCKSCHRSLGPVSNIRALLDNAFPERDVTQVFQYMSESGLVYSALRVQVLWLIEVWGEDISPEAKSFLHSLVNRHNADHIMNGLIDAKHNDVPLYFIHNMIWLLDADHNGVSEGVHNMNELVDANNADDDALYYVEAVRSFLKGVYSDAEVVDSSCTEEDIDSLARGLMLKDAMDNVVLPAMDEVIAATSAAMAMDYACFEPVFSLVDDLNNIASRLGEQRAEISHCKIGGDFYAQGNSSNAHLAQKFVQSLGLSVKPHTYQTQTYARPLISAIALFNMILMDFDSRMSQLIELHQKGVSRLSGDFAYSKTLLHIATFSRTLPRVPKEEEEGALPLASNKTFFWGLIEDIYLSLIGYQIAKDGIRKLKEFMLHQPNFQ